MSREDIFQLFSNHKKLTTFVTTIAGEKNYGIFELRQRKSKRTGRCSI